MRSGRPVDLEGYWVELWLRSVVLDFAIFICWVLALVLS